MPGIEDYELDEIVELLPNFAQGNDAYSSVFEGSGVFLQFTDCKVIESTWVEEPKTETIEDDDIAF